MALRSLKFRKQIDLVNKQLEELRTKAEALAVREAELEQAIAEAETDEDLNLAEEEIAKFEADKAENTEQTEALEKQCEDLERELSETEQKANTPPPAAEGGENTRGKELPVMENLAITTTRAKELFGNMTLEQRTALFESEKVKAFTAEIRSCIAEKRALTNAGLLIPKEFLGLIRENIINYSKLYKHAYVRQVRGEGRTTIMGTIPEAVWTEMCANLNELDLGFNQAEVDGYKVGGFIPVCNATLEDSEIDLAAEIITTLGQAIGLALDKAILFGTGTKMPLGIVPRLVQTSEPANYPANARPWVDLHTSNVKALSSSLEGLTLYRQIMLDGSAAKGKYSRDEKVWCMNESTYTALKAAMLSVNAAGAVVSGINGTLPVIGGIVEVLEFIPDNYIIGGYFDNYLLAERAGTRIEQSEHVRFLEDQTVFKGTARYDGLPVIAEAFVALGLGNTSISGTAVTFAPDTANPNAAGKLADLAITGVTLTPAFATATDTYTGATTTASATITATPQDGFDAVSITYNDAYIPNGGTVKWTAGAGNVVVVSVKDSTTGTVSSYTVTVTKS